MSTVRGAVAALPLLAVIVAGSGAASAERLAAQEVTRTEVVVDYVAGDDVYFNVGVSQGLGVGDTLAVFRSQDPGSAAFTRVLVTAASRVRSVVAVLEGGSVLARGETLYVVNSGGAGVDGELRVAGAPVGSQPSQPGEAVSVRTEERPQIGVQQRPRPRWSGRVSVDVDARENEVSWTGNLAGQTRRRFATPVGRLTLRGTDLPGGWRVDANLRLAYRYTDGPAVTPPTSFRAYGLSVANRIQSLRMDVRLGRFSSPYESYSTYWDGLLVRLGSERGGGIGVAVGLQPNRYDEAPSGDTRKLTGFVDYRAGRGAKRYATDASIHVIRPSNGLVAPRTFVGWTQRVTLGTVRFDQRLQLDRDEATGTWSLTRLRLRSSVGLGPTRLEMGVGRSKPTWARSGSGVTTPSRDEANAGVTITQPGVRVGLRVGVTQREGEEYGTTIVGSARGSFGRMGLSASASRWSQSTASTTSLSPAIDFRLGASRTRLSYRYYHVDGLGVSTSHTAEIGTTLSLHSRIQLRVQAQQQWGPTYKGTRISTGLSRSF